MKPRWKIITELIFGVLWLTVPTLIWSEHIHDDLPFNVIWIVVALLNAQLSVRLVTNSWKEL